MNPRGHSPRGIGRRVLLSRALPVFFALLVAVGCKSVPATTYWAI